MFVAGEAVGEAVAAGGGFAFGVRASALETGIYREESTVLARMDRQGREYHEFLHEPQRERPQRGRSPPTGGHPGPRFTAGGKGPDNFTRLARYETAIERSIERGMKHLKALKAARNAQCPAVPETPHAPEPPAPEPPNPPSTPSDSMNYEPNPEDPPRPVINNDE